MPTSLANEFVASLRAPHKEFVTIPGAGHFAVFMKSDEFLRELGPRASARDEALRPAADVSSRCIGRDTPGSPHA